MSDPLKAYWDMVLSTPEEMAKKLAICSSCEHLDSSVTPRMCTACGCGVDLKVKKRTTSCPLGKWVATVSLDE
jgi:hypothetical protein